MRRGWTTIGVALLLAAAIAAANASEPLRVGEAVPQSFTFTLVDFGMKRGLYAKEGIEVAPQVFGGPVKQQQALAAGSIDVALGVGLDIGFLAKGTPAKAVAAMAGPPLDTGIIVMPNAPLQSAADLKGRSVGVTSQSSLLAWLVGEVAVKQGWPRDAIRTVPSGSTTAQLALLKTGQLDGAGSDLAPALQLEAAGEARILVRFGDLIHGGLNNVIMASDALIASRPDDLRAFLRGWFATLAYARGHRDETIADMTPLLGIDRRFVAAIYDRQMPMYSADGHFTPDALATAQRAIVDVKLADTPPPLDKLYTEAFLK